MIRRALVLAFFAVLAFPAVGFAQEDGVVRGTVTNGTEDGGDVAGATVELNHFEGMDLLETYTTTIQDDGTFLFENLSTESGEAYLATVEYNGISFNSDMILLSQEPESDSEITVYEQTDDPSVIEVISRGVVVATADSELGLVEILEIIAIENTSDRTYVGGEDGVLRLGLPNTATSIAPQAGFDFGRPEVDGSTLITTGPVNPGSHDPMISYSVPYEGTSVRLTIENAMDTGTLRVLTREGTYDLRSSVLTPGETVEVGSDEYDVIAMDNPVVGDVITFSISGLPRGDWGLPVSMGTLLASLAAGVGLVVGAVLIYQVVQRRSSQQSPQLAYAGATATPDTQEPGGDLEKERLELASELNELDDEHQKGAIDQETYEQERSEILEELRAISLRMRGVEDTSG